MALIVAVHVGLWHSLSLYWAAVVPAGLTFGASPGIHVQPYLPFAAAIVLAEIHIAVTRRGFIVWRSQLLSPWSPWLRPRSLSPASASGARPLPYIIDHNDGGGGVDALVEKDLERFARIRLGIGVNRLTDID